MCSYSHDDMNIQHLIQFYMQNEYNSLRQIKCRRHPESITEGETRRSRVNRITGYGIDKR